MSKSVSHAVSTREPYITPRATGPRGDIGRGLIRHVIQILPLNFHYIIYFNHAFDNTCILWIFFFFFGKFWNFEIIWVYDIGMQYGIRYRVCDIGYKPYRLGTIIDNAYTKHLYFNLNICLTIALCAIKYLNGGWGQTIIERTLLRKLKIDQDKPYTNGCSRVFRKGRQFMVH